jgi:ADP-ribose pyrophosphatase YjhB (NUDIX family)
MAFGDTITIGAKELNLINQDNYSSEYLLRDVLEETRLKIRHTNVKATTEFAAMTRHNVELRVLVYATVDDPAYYRLDYFVVQRLPNSADVVDTDALADWQILTTNVNLYRLLNWES